MNRDISIARTMVEKALLQTTPANLNLDEWQNKKISYLLEATDLQKDFWIGWPKTKSFTGNTYE